MNSWSKLSNGNARVYFVLSLFLIFACAAMPAAVSAESAAQISAAGTGLPKADMVITGSGFKPGEIVELELDLNGLPILLGEKEDKPVAASDKGTFEIKTGNPDKSILVPGEWDLFATGDKGSKAQCKVLMKLQ
jgi:hypothetical protein